MRKPSRMFRSSLIVAVVLALAMASPLVGAASASVDALTGQVQVAMTHATFSLGSDDLDSRQLHAHHVVNILEGENGANFDSSKGNPGDGYGALNYASEVAAPGDEAAANVVTYLEWANDEALAATVTDDYEAAGEAINRSLAYLSAALGREDGEGVGGGALSLGGSSAGVVTIDIHSFSFGDGETLMIAVGTTVEWTNLDAAPHTVTGGPLDSGTMNEGDTYSFTFDEPGTYDYICVFHPMMTHTIVVH